MEGLNTPVLLGLWFWTMFVKFFLLMSDYREYWFTFPGGFYVFVYFRSSYVRLVGNRLYELCENLRPKKKKKT